ncbi:MAG: hypothetical protein HOO04_08875 [Phycisphaerae bacterium]|jgi:hypothetical protein|nr:hypothetical protein [Phycisphaerae bacterium]MBT5382185.1 hypothetical protein [Phycisphaerae bacterium]
MTLAWIPFLQPVPELVSLWYLLCIPLVIGVAMVYKALWIPEGRSWGQQVIMMSVLMVGGLAGLAILLGAFVQIVIPRL